MKIRSFFVPVAFVAMILPGCIAGTACTAQGNDDVWVHGGFKDFSKGRFDDGGSNLYVNAHGVIEMIHRWDVNNDGYADIFLTNSEDHGERAPTRVFSVEPGKQKGWKYQEMSGESGTNSRIADLDNDGYEDLVVANGDSGISCEISSFVYWGGPEGAGKERTDLPTIGAYDVAIADINRDGRLDLIFPSTWKDRHNSAEPKPAKVYLAAEDRQFQDATDRYNITCIGTMGIAAADLNGDGFVDLVMANTRSKYDFTTESFVYWGKKDGFDVEQPVRLPTNSAESVLTADLNHDGTDDIVFSGGSQIRIFWNRNGRFNARDRLFIAPSTKGEAAERHVGSTLSFAVGNCAVADLDGDGKNDLVLSTDEGIQIRSGADIKAVQLTLPLEHSSWVTAGDLNGDGRPDLVVSRIHDGVSRDTESAIFWNGRRGFSMDRVSWAPTLGTKGNSVGDLNGDDRPEVVFNNGGDGRLSGITSYIYLGNQEASYSEKRRIELPRDEAYDSCVADLNLDGYPDVVLAGCDFNNTRIFNGGPDGPSPTQFVDLMGSNSVVTSIGVADFNRDGYLDLLTAGLVYDTRPETLAKSSFIYYGSKDGFSNSRAESLESYGGGVHLADINRDGYLDVLFGDKRDFILVYLGGKAGFSKNRTDRIPCPIPCRINTADLNEDGWLDVIVGQHSHGHRREESLAVFYSSPDGGFRPENSRTFKRGHTVLRTGVADFNRDGHLDLVATAYATPTARVIPATLHWGNGQRIDLEHPVELPASSSAGVTAMDFDRDGWIDIILANHRNNASHKIDSLLYWNNRGRFDIGRVTRLPSLGAHGTTCRDFGNAYTRQPQESYISPAFELKGRTATKIHWQAEVRRPSRLKFQLRWASAKEQLDNAQWMGPNGPNTYYEQSGQPVGISADKANWLQYQAVFVSPYGCRSPKLREVRVNLESLTL